MKFPAMDMTEWLVVQRKHENTNCILGIQKEVEHKKYKCEQCSFESSTEALLIEHNINDHEGILKTPPNKRRKKITDDDMDTDENEDLVRKIEELVIVNKKELQKKEEKEEEKKRSQLRDEKVIQKQKMIELKELKKKTEEEAKRRKEVETNIREKNQKKATKKKRKNMKEKEKTNFNFGIAEIDSKYHTLVGENKIKYPGPMNGNCQGASKAALLFLDSTKGPELSANENRYLVAHWQFFKEGIVFPNIIKIKGGEDMEFEDKKKLP